MRVIYSHVEYRVKVMAEPTTTTYALLGLLAVKSWTGYELTQQARRSLRYAWPSSEANLYREQQRLVRMGWATVEAEAVGDRTRCRHRCDRLVS